MIENVIVTHDMPTAYDLGVGAEGKSLQIKVPGEVANYLRDTLSASKIPLVTALQQKFNLPDFSRKFEDKWGFGSVLECKSSNERNWVTWDCDFPQYSRVITKEEIRRFYSLSASLRILFENLRFVDEEVEWESDSKQLVAVTLDQDYNLGGSPLWVTLAKRLMPWLASFPDWSTIPQVEISIRQAYEFMNQKQMRRAFYSVLFRQPKWVFFSCPGEACDLGHEYFESETLDRGYQLIPHNVDSIDQQLTLLVGVAGLHDLARQAGL